MKNINWIKEGDMGSTSGSPAEKEIQSIIGWLKNDIPLDPNTPYMTPQKSERVMNLIWDLADRAASSISNSALYRWVGSFPDEAERGFAEAEGNVGMESLPHDTLLDVLRVCYYYYIEGRCWEIAREEGYDI